MINITDLAIDLAHMLSHGEGKSILVAGQALSFWGEYYLSDSFSLAERSPLASRDIDFFNKRNANVNAHVRSVHEYLRPLGLDLEITNAQMEDNATGLWFIRDSSGSSDGITVDFLNFISGLTDEEIEQNSEEVTVNGKAFRILSPVFCLKARVNNLLCLYPNLRMSPERMENEEARVRLAIQIVKAHMSELHYWVDGGEVKVKKRIKQMTKLCNANLGKRLYKEYGICLMDAIPRDVIDERFYANTYTNTIEKLERYRSGGHQPIHKVNGS